jgi:hypothetical protein
LVRTTANANLIPGEILAMDLWENSRAPVAPTPMRDPEEDAEFFWSFLMGK